MSELVTGHGVLQLPTFFPDATRAVVRSVGSDDLVGCGGGDDIRAELERNGNPPPEFAVDDVSWSVVLRRSR